MKIDRLLAEHQLLVTTAESCTGGLVASALVDIPGISDYFKEGYITYAPEAKEKILGVLPETISDYGVVSEQTAQEMAEGAAKQAHAGCAVATTGVAGPGGGTLKTPVGTVCFGCFVQGKIFSGTEHFTGTRSEISSLPLKTIEGLETRPTTDKIKETLFNMLQNDVPGCYFLDLFAGSGQIGLEAISRGALYAVFIENNRKAAKCIEDNIAFTKFTKESRLLTTDVISGISSLEGKYTFDIIFMDIEFGDTIGFQVG